LVANILVSREAFKEESRGFAADLTYIRDSVGKTFNQDIPDRYTGLFVRTHIKTLIRDILKKRGYKQTP
jgi:hypothetical protein